MVTMVQLDLWISISDAGVLSVISISGFRLFRIPGLNLRYPARLNKSKLMDPPNADILELKEMMRELFKVVQGLALGQKAIAERLERIESWMIKEKAQGKVPSSVVKKPSGNGQPEKEVESGGVPARKEHGKDRYHPYVATVTTPIGNPPRLRDLGLVRPRILVPVEPHRGPANYDENARCEFHSGTPGHNIEGCRAFKHVVQDMVDSKAISLAPTLNVNANPMPGPVEVKVMSRDKRGIEVTDGDQLKIPKSVVQKHLMKSGSFPSVDNCCAAVVTNGCSMMRETTQKMSEVEMDV
ncbi:hypothetical protein KIW84_044121 [Lathyrus oleraceus]|uniref:Uncharacterized protein n=1 Tax=Pisum sativum TaxID=3888 RepID=A0A9D4XJG3_PEA|nr:hypothetical protein KIW84_044121 [Pisum sativum]